MNDNRELAVFRRLATHGSHLALAQAFSEAAHAEDYVVISSGERRVSPVTASRAEVTDWLSRGLIEPCPEGYRLAAAGLAWLRRALSAAQPFQAQHQAREARIIDFEGAKRPAIVNNAESPLAWLASRKDKNGVPLLAAFQFEAGERLRADYHFAGISAKVTASWNPAATSNGNGGSQNDAAALADNVLAARQRVVRALAGVGPELSGVLVDVCCHLKGLEEAEKTEGWPQRSGKVILQIALTRLARHYGLVSDGQLTAGLKRRLQHWGTEDYRPKVGS
jgi:Domain of unknown function (DUF6456)